MKRIGFFFALLAVCTVGFSQDAKNVKAGTATLVVGNVTFTAANGGKAEKLTTGTVLAVGATITTGVDARAVILTSRQSAIRIGANSTVVLDEMTASAGAKKQPKVRVSLRRGSLGALIKSKELGAMDFSVKTPHGVAAARGTFYAVAVTADKSYTQVKEGTVEVKTNDDGKPDEQKDELGKAIPSKGE